MHRYPRHVEDLLAEFPSVLALARYLQVSPETAYAWGRRNRIPEWRWRSIVMAAEHFKVDGLSYSVLSDLAHRNRP